MAVDNPSASFGELLRDHRRAAGLTQEELAERTAAYDRENRFFWEDFEELREAGYLKIAVPNAFGGFGLSLAEVVREQRRLADRAPATALAVNMHLYWTGVAADLRPMGDPSLEWLLREAAEGEVFAVGRAASTTAGPGR
jgi:alkylation response protein AidB-like acyl-CoA dehydrogenase